MRRSAHWGVPLALAGAAVMVAFGGDAARRSLRFDRGAIADGEPWRLLTGHLAHLGTSHTLLNVVALILVWILVGGGWPAGAWCLIVVASVAGIDLGLWLFDPALEWYVGLSGVLHGLFAGGLVARYREAPLETLLLAGLLAAKIAFEQAVGPLPGSVASSGGAVVVDAHLYGAMAGGLAALMLRIGVNRSVSI